MIRFLILILLSSCATKIKETQRRKVQYVDPYSSVDISWKDQLDVRDKEQLINVYWDFYAFSSRKSCPQVTYKKSYPANKNMNLPGIEFGEIKPGNIGDKNVLHGGSFDLTTEDGQQYKFFQIQTDELESKVTTPEDNRIVLLKTGKPGDIRYIACNDRPGQSIVCTEDKMMPGLVNVNDTEKLCQFLKLRKTAMSQEKFLNGILSIIDRIEIK